MLNCERKKLFDCGLIYGILLWNFLTVLLHDILAGHVLFILVLRCHLTKLWMRVRSQVLLLEKLICGRRKDGSARILTAR